MTDDDSGRMGLQRFGGGLAKPLEDRDAGFWAKGLCAVLQETAADSFSRFPGQLRCGVGEAKRSSLEIGRDCMDDG